ncbi:MAG: bifunctional tRNA (5-methylaminomethyl-2-thiouridine)(34)-methyltransferase MnmD/FAD-dependent 5-carboxymethylaminomethyl-2-thiouridine(34) oxidoreductase MnmC [Pseudomonadota bacterium]
MTDSVHWDENGQPVSMHFDDVYFSKADGLQESRYVFQQHNQLEQRFRQLTAGEHFVVGETGFGTGLNFLACWQQWDQCAATAARLHYISTEKHPLSPEQLARSLQLWPELNRYSDPLLRWYKRSLCDRGSAVTLYFKRNNIHLTLLVGDATQGLAAQLGEHHPQQGKPVAYWHGVDAWFLDGFAPAKNPDMWSLPLCKTLAALSRKHTTFATFTAAGQVKRHLQDCGFEVKKVPGFGKKRDMLCGKFTPTSNNKNENKKANKKTVFHWTQVDNFQALAQTSHIAIIGAGLAGCHSAYALAKKGFKVSVIDRHCRLANEGSGNPQGILYSKLSADQGKLGEFNLAALLLAQEMYRDFWQAHPYSGQNNGVLQLGHDEKILSINQQIAQTFGNSPFVRLLNPQQASEQAGLALNQSALFFPFCGWLNPTAVCRWLTQSPNIKLLTHTSVEKLDFLKSSEQWSLNGQQHSQQWQQTFDAVVIANAGDAQQFEQSLWLPTKKIRGQITYIAKDPVLKPLNTNICARGYISPLTQDENRLPFHAIGASFNLNNFNTALSDQDHRDNLAHLQRVLPQVKHPAILGGRVGFRCTSPDYLPLVGSLPDIRAFESDFLGFSHNAKQLINKQGQYHRHLYLNVAHGSKGLNYTPLAGAIIAHRIAGEPPPCSQTVVDSVNPARFIIRRIVRAKTK